MSLSLLGFLPHPSPLPSWWYHYMSILLCLEKYAFAKTFPFCGDSLLTHGTRWSVGGPAVLAAHSFCLAIYSNLFVSLHSPPNTFRLIYCTCFMVARKKKAIWGSGLIAFLSVCAMSTIVYSAKTHFVDHMCISFLSSRAVLQCSSV